MVPLAPASILPRAAPRLVPMPRPDPALPKKAGRAEDPRDPLEGRDLFAIVGPTATGKSALGLAVAERAGAEIVSLDSMLVYRGMDVGTAKPTTEERARVPHHLVDVVDPPERYDVQRFLVDVRARLEQLPKERRVLFVGGTAFFLKVLLDGLFDGPPVDLELRQRLQARLAEEGGGRLHAELERVDPRSAARIHANDSKRLIRALEVFEQTGKCLSEWQQEWGWHGAAKPARPREQRLVALDVLTDDLDERIRRRVRTMLENGWIEEVARIHCTCGFGPTSIQALGYAQVLDLVESRITREQAEEMIAVRTRQFARRQRTWYRKFEGMSWVQLTARGFGDHHVTDILRGFGWD